ncbi:hypothetical protein [Pseudomonas syringae]|uniref:hypothetical protein n=1 Tax=Pseudomonas syringae TaxID=317 RepID=UPI003F754AB1
MRHMHQRGQSLVKETKTLRDHKQMLNHHPTTTTADAQPQCLGKCFCHFKKPTISALCQHVKSEQALYRQKQFFVIPPPLAMLSSTNADIGSKNTRAKTLEHAAAATPHCQKCTISMHTTTRTQEDNNSNSSLLVKLLGAFNYFL